MKTFPLDWQVNVRVKDLIMRVEPLEGELAVDFKARVREQARLVLAAGEQLREEAFQELEQHRCPSCGTALESYSRVVRQGAPTEREGHCGYCHRHWRWGVIDGMGEREVMCVTGPWSSRSTGSLMWT